MTIHPAIARTSTHRTFITDFFLDTTMAMSSPYGVAGAGAARGGGNDTSRFPAVNSSSGLPFGYVPAYLPGSASLVEQLDSELLIVLRDGRHLIGTLKSFDQFSNMVLEDTSERHMTIYKGKRYVANMPLGLYVIKGDSIVLLGEVMSPQQQQQQQEEVQEVSFQELEELEQSNANDSNPLEWDFDTDLVA